MENGRFKTMKNHESISDKIDVGKLKKGSEKPNWICKDCYDGGIVVEQPIDKKIAEEFQKYEKTFTENKLHQRMG